MIIDLVIGARPNFVKAAAILEAAKKYPSVNINLVHTGQHNHKGEMADPFFKEFEFPVVLVPEIDIHLPCFHFNKMEIFSHYILYLSNVFSKHNPDYVMVVGDTDSTAAGAIAAAKMNIPVIHVEAGLRCGDMAMQEEINRILVDSVSEICFTTTGKARDVLIGEGHDPESVHFVGNVMVDTLYRFLPEAKKKYLPRIGPYAVLTLHRAENVDHDDVIFPMLDAIRDVANEIDIVWPIHPRLRSRICAWKDNGKLHFVEPMGYLQFISLISSAKFVMTDSGGVQEETTALGVPCLTLRTETERPETIWEGSNWLVGTHPDDILGHCKLLAASDLSRREYHIPELWDGYAADRIMSYLVGRAN